MFKCIFMFIENGYTVDLLKEVERQEIEELIGHPFLAERTKFISGLNKWREGQGLPPVSTPSGGSAGCTEGRLENINRQDCTAKLLINASPKGRAVIQSYKDTNVLTRSQKRIITHIVVDEFKDRFGKLTRHELVLRAAELRQLFPTESEYTWYQPAVEFQGSKKIKLGKLAKGCLHDRNSNYKPDHHNAHNLPEEAAGPSQTQDVLSEGALSEYEQIKKWIRHHEDEWATVKEKWAATCALRLLEISKHQNWSCEELLDAFPTLRKPEGYQLIITDFKYKFPKQHNLLFERWNEFRTRIRPILDSDVTDATGKSILNILNETSLNEDTCDWLIATLLAYLLPCPMLTSRDRKKWKPTYMDARESFVLWIKGLDELEAEIARINLVAGRCNQTQRPLVIVVGSTITEVSTFLVYFGGIYYNLPTFQKALDVCYKTYKIYGVTFPRPASGVWNLINHCIYGFEPEIDCKARVISIGNGIAATR
nr:uncharacterized protein LOC109414040 [Aedes albopictus]